MSSVAASIASLSPEKQAAILDGLTTDGAAALLTRWEFWARPDQLPPAGAWRAWLILAGRGWGKTHGAVGDGPRVGQDARSTGGSPSSRAPQRTCGT